MLGDVSFNAGAGNIELADMSVGAVSLGFNGNVTDITLRNLDGVKFWIANATRTKVLGGDWGPWSSGYSSRVAPSDPSAPVAVDTLIEGIYAHDISAQPGGEHAEGIMVYGGKGIVIRGCRFDRIGSTGDLGLFLLSGPTPEISNMLIENCQGSTQGNPPYAYYNVQITKALYQKAGIVLRNNNWPKKAPGGYAGAEGELLVS